MLGKKRDWLRWMAAAVAAILAVRVGLYLLLPGLPPPFAWGGSVMLGLALMFLLAPLPHEALLAYRLPPEQHPDRPADR